MSVVGVCKSGLKVRVRFPIADKSLADRRHIVSLTPLSNTRGAAVAAVVGDVYYCVIVSHYVTRIRQRYYSIVRMICDELTECAVQQLTVNFLICNSYSMICEELTECTVQQLTVNFVICNSYFFMSVSVTQ